MSFKGAFEAPCNYCNQDHSVLNCPYISQKKEENTPDPTDADYSPEHAPKFDCFKLLPGVFTPGRLYVSLEAQRLFDKHQRELAMLVQRHLNGDWGRVRRAQRSLNDLNVMCGTGEIISRYTVGLDYCVQLVTGPSRSVTEVSIVKPEQENVL